MGPDTDEASDPPHDDSWRTPRSLAPTQSSGGGGHKEQNSMKQELWCQAIETTVQGRTSSSNLLLQWRPSNRIRRVPHNSSWPPSSLQTSGSQPSPSVLSTSSVAVPCYPLVRALPAHSFMCSRNIARTIGVYTHSRQCRPRWSRDRGRRGAGPRSRIRGRPAWGERRGEAWWCGVSARARCRQAVVSR